MAGIDHPPVQLEYVVDAWQEMGLKRASEPLTWSDIGAYCQLSGIQLTSQECMLIRNMSAAYFNQLMRRSPDELSPYQSQTQKPANIADKFRSAGRNK